MIRYFFERVIRMERQEFDEIILKNAESFFDYFRLACIAVRNEKVAETSAFLEKTFEKLGAKKVEQWREEGANPVVFAEFSGKSKETILFYNHYDVQPPEPVEEWNSDPFEPTIEDERLIVRGACDDKGELVMRLALLKYFNEHGGLPVNVKFFVEGEEEVGSPNVEKYIQAHLDELKCDACIWEGGQKDANERFEIVVGLKGIVAFEAEVKTSNGDLHSSKSCYAPNAAVRLTKGLASLFDDSGKILVEGLNLTEDSLDRTERALVKKMRCNQKELKENDGIIEDLITDDVSSAIVCEPSLSINGLSAGYEADGIKTIIPGFAKAKLDCRLAPCQDPEESFEKIQAQLEKNGYPDIRLTYLTGQPGYRSDVHSPFVKMVLKQAEEIFGADGTSYVLNSPIAGPAYAFGRNLKVPIAGFGIGYPGQKMHAPNENIRLSDFCDAAWYLKCLLEKYR